MHWKLLPRAGAAALIGSLLAILVVDVIAQRGAGRIVAAVNSGKQSLAPQFKLHPLNTGDAWKGRLRRLSHARYVQRTDFRGEITVVNFWASWCHGCKKEQGDLVAASRQFASQVAFVGIDENDSTSAARSYWRRYKVPYPTLLDRDITASGEWGVAAIPETFVLDRHGRIIDHQIGPVDRVRLERVVKGASRRRPAVA